MKHPLAMLLLLGLLGGPAAATPMWELSAEDKRMEPLSMAKGLSSSVIPGLGQALNEDNPKGLVHFGLAAALVGAFFIPAATIRTETTDSKGKKVITTDLSIVGFALGLANVTFHLYSGLDAYQVSDKIKKKKGEPF